MTVYFARTVSYVSKMFMKSTTGVNALKLFFFVTDASEQEALVFVQKKQEGAPLVVTTNY